MDKNFNVLKGSILRLKHRVLGNLVGIVDKSFNIDMNCYISILGVQVISEKLYYAGYGLVITPQNLVSFSKLENTHKEARPIGVLDVNSKEMFTGDIVEIKMVDIPGCISGYGVISQRKYEGKFVCIWYPYDIITQPDPRSFHYYKVIGNLWESPEKLCQLIPSCRIMADE